MTKFSDLKGKTVVDWEGSIVGKIEDIDINLINYSMQSIVVHQGLFKHHTKIMVEYIDKFDEDKVFLKISPVSKLVGKRVFDSAGQLIGKITEVDRVGETNVLEGIVVKMRVTIPRAAGSYEKERPLPGERGPVGDFRVSAESPLTVPSSDIEEDMPMSSLEDFKEEMTIPSKFIDSLGEFVQLKVTKEELFAEIF